MIVIGVRIKAFETQLKPAMSLESKCDVMIDYNCPVTLNLCNWIFPFFHAYF